MNLVQQIKEIFWQTPSDLKKIRRLLMMRKFTKDELAELAVGFVGNCFGEYRDALNPEFKFITIENMHSNYVVEAIDLLLEFGLDPNTIVHDENVLWNTKWIDAPNVAASVMRLLLENGGDPNHFIPAEFETLFENITYKVSRDEQENDYLYTVRCWLLLMAYGGCWRIGKIPITMLNGKSVEIFKEFELYDYGIEYLPQESGKYGYWILHIFNIKTKEEVARYG
ncbi:MAG: hypothetical protein IJF54_07710 [Clostridia bacterium]|nr:hypothetical protein [Clostridia bacterium]